MIAKSRAPVCRGVGRAVATLTLGGSARHMVETPPPARWPQKGREHTHRGKGVGLTIVLHTRSVSHSEASSTMDPPTPHPPEAMAQSYQDTAQAGDGGAAPYGGKVAIHWGEPCQS
mmetsp:Transcript_3398/g.5798  ORF Transcript_3398/g.5798 Transcript_3398/m.5798 type:complete len:116 (+) Transcript_3398:278-625(+)